MQRAWFVRLAAIALTLAWSGAGATALMWFDGAHPSAQAREAVQLFTNAASHGLAPQDYDAEALGRDVERLLRETAPSDDDRADLDRRLNTSMRLYLSHLKRGRLDPRRIHHDFAAPRDEPFDAGAVLHQALATNRLAQAVAAAAPQIPMYDQMRQALARYRALSDHPAWRQSMPALPTKLEPGQLYAGLAILAQRLHALGDLESVDGLPPHYDQTLAQAVRQFQERHALAVDGIIGRATLAQLQVTPEARTRQIELTLERLRWTPLLQGPRMIVINIPEFVLRAYEVQDGRIRVQREMKIIVGKALNTRTPLFDEDMRFVEFSPYWNVPPSIARQETVPKLRRNPALWDREGFEFVAGDGRVLTGLSADRLDAVLAGKLRIRQRPGPRNALGDIKFVFPNRANIYLHHTPSVSLFERDRRDFSHGCIRVEAPVALATFVLQHHPDWPEQRIRQAMAAGQSFTLKLDAPVPVLIAYGTTLVKQGRIFFFDDLYGLDRVLDAALRQSTAPRPVAN